MEMAPHRDYVETWQAPTAPTAVVVLFNLKINGVTLNSAWSLVNLSTFRKGSFHLRMRRPLDLSFWNGYLQHLCSSKKLFFRNFVVHF